MKIATWNVNSIRPRGARLLSWLARHQPDVLCLQEIKVPDGEFPALELLGAGYHAAVHGQKGYNGVAILSRRPPEDVLRGLEDGEDDRQARLVAATVGGVRVLSAYAPNGQEVGSEAYAYKLRWFLRLRAYLESRCDPAQPLVLCGDLNVAPEPRDVYDPALWEREALFHFRAREALADVCQFGLVDTFRLHHPEGGLYSWWDYRSKGFEKNLGLRIDHILATRPLAERCSAALVDKEERAGAAPSDHAPVIAEFAPRA